MREELSIAAILSMPNLFRRPRGGLKQADEARMRFVMQESDHLTLLNAFHAYCQAKQDGFAMRSWLAAHFLSRKALESAVALRAQLQAAAARQGLPTDGGNLRDPLYLANIRKSLLAGFFQQVAHLDADR